MASKAVLQAIKPGAPIVRSEKFLKAYIQTLKDVTDGMKEDYRKTTKTWKKKPRFTTQLPKTVGSNIEASAGTDNVIYGYVDEGTPAHVIRPKKGKFLVFRPNFYRKTIPGVLSSTKGGQFGRPVFAKKVNHPGTKPRKFTITIQQKWQPELEKRMEKATEKAAEYD